MPNDPIMRENVARILEALQIQQDALFDLEIRIQALEMALKTNQNFAALYQRTLEMVRNPEIVQSHDEKMRWLDEAIQQLRKNSVN